MRHNIQKLLDYQLNKSINTLHTQYNLEKKNINTYIKSLINFNTLNNNTSINTLIENKLYYLLDNVPDFIHLNQTLTSMTNNFIQVCNKSNIDTTIIDEDYVNKLLILYIDKSTNIN